MNLSLCKECGCMTKIIPAVPLGSYRCGKCKVYKIRIGVYYEQENH